jgi:seipin
MKSDIQNAVSAPFRVLFSKRAQKAYIGTFLFVGATIVLIGISTVAYWVFYMNYVPQIGLERVVHLQFGYVWLRNAGIQLLDSC